MDGFPLLHLGPVVRALAPILSQAAVDAKMGLTKGFFWGMIEAMVYAAWEEKR
jgi:hypothetical protein